MPPRSSFLTAGFLIPASLLLPLSSSLAADVSWDNPGAGAFTTNTNWDTDAVPTASDNAIIANGGTAQLTTGESASVIQLRVNDGAMTQDAASVTTGITSSSWQTTGDLQIGGTSGQTGSLTVSGASTIDTGRVRIGGYNNGSDSTNVAGSLTMTGGALTTANGYDFWLGSGSGGSATMNLSGSSHINVQNTGTAGRNGASATAIQSGTSLFQTAGGFVFGEGGSSDWTVEENAAVQIGGTVNLGGGNGANSTMTVQDSATLSSGNEFWVGNGEGATSVLNVEGGTVTSASWVAIGRGGAKGTLNVSGGSFTKNGVGNHFVTNGSATDVATINHTGGTITNTGSEMQLSEGSSNVTAWSASAGTGNFGDFQIGRDGSATLTIGGTANYTATTVRLGVNGTGSGVLNLDGGTLTANSVTEVAGTGTINFNGGTLRAGAASADFLGGFEDVDLNLLGGGLIFDTNGFAISITQGIAGVGGLTKIGTGSLTFSSINMAYEGNTSITGGTLSISSVFLSDTSNVLISGSGVFDLNFVGTDTINQLFINGLAQSAGTWGAIGSGAQHESAFFTGDGILMVAVPEPGAYAMGVFGLLALAALVRGKRLA